tara:strand:- start:2755 stop:4230 length:1476 start_codon:yes stop_codon:yes gene_type:complete
MYVPFIMGHFNLFGKSQFNSGYILILIVLFGISLRLFFFSGMDISDSLVYSEASHDLLKGDNIDFENSATLSTRLGVIYPISFSYLLFGVNEFSSILFVLITSIGSIILIYLFGKLYFNSKVGLISAFLFSIFPLNVFYSTRINSDISSAFFMGVGLYLFLRSELKGNQNYIHYFLSGIFIGIGYLIRESVILIGLFFITYILINRKIKYIYFLVPLGILFILGFEMILFYNLTGDPFYRSLSSQDFLKDAMIKHNYFGRRNLPEGLFHYPWLFLTNKLLVFFYIPIFISLLYYFINLNKKISPLLLWFIVLLLYLSFGSSNLLNYSPFGAVARYTTIITIPGILIFSKFIYNVKLMKIRKLMPTILIVLLVISLSVLTLNDNRELLKDLKKSYPFIDTLNKNTYADSRSIMAYNFISDFNLSKNLLEYPAHFEKINDSFIIVNRNMLRNLLAANNNIVFPEDIINIPAHWILVAEFGELKHDKIEIYYLK